MAYTPTPNKNEDAAHADGDPGIPILAVRRDADSTSVSTDGDYEALHMNQYGRLKVSSQPAAIDATTGTITANAQTVVADVARASNVMVQISGTYAGVNISFEASVDAGTTYFAVQAVRSDANTIETTSGALTNTTRAWELSVNAMTNFRVRATAFTSGSAAIRILPGVFATEPIPAAQTHAVTGSGNFAVTIATNTPVGNVAHDAVDSGAPMKQGGKAYSTNPVKVASADRADFISDLQGKQVVVGSIRDLKVQQVTTIANTTETTVLTAGAASVFHDVYGVIVTNTSATATTVAFKDATAGTTRFTIAAPAGDTRGFMLNESAAHSQSTAAQNWTATAAASVSSLAITVLAVKNL